jgi:hypothetical protein
MMPGVELVSTSATALAAAGAGGGLSSTADQLAGSLLGVSLFPAMMPGAELVSIPATALAAAGAGGGLSSTADQLAGSLFGASLFPWLAMLYWLAHPKVCAPPGVSFGLTFLLAFVFSSIPAAIGAGLLYGVTLADADWLHGAAESLLAITNCIVVLGFRDALSGAGDQSSRLRTAAALCGGLSALSALAVFAVGGAQVHTAWLGGVGNLPVSLWPAEPVNALSIPTWIIHTSSLVEWLVAMGLAWRYADVTSRPEWKGVTWGMLPLHTSGIIACTYHLFYNAESLSWCVALQAAMTCLGNTTLAWACLRLAIASGWTWADAATDVAAAFSAVQQPAAGIAGAGARGRAPEPATGRLEYETVGPSAGASPGGVSPESDSGGGALVGWEDLGDTWAADSDAFFLAKLALMSATLAYAAKYAPALLPRELVYAWGGLPDGADSAAALAVIVVPTLLNCVKWRQRSKEDGEFVGDF